MGVYWKAVNLDTRQSVEPHPCGDGAKWREWIADDDDDATEWMDSPTMRRVRTLYDAKVWTLHHEVRLVSDAGETWHFAGPASPRFASYDSPDRDEVAEWVDVSTEVS